MKKTLKVACSALVLLNSMLAYAENIELLWRARGLEAQDKLDEWQNSGAKKYPS